MKRVFISLDTEGLSGVTSWKQMETDPSFAGKAYIRELGWILDELFQCCPDLEEVTLCDSHSRGENLPYGVFTDKRIAMVEGYPRQDYMLATLDSSYDLLMLVGYHPMIGSKFGVMDHSYSSSGLYAVRINGTPVGEVELNCFCAAQFGVPLGFVSGDDVLERELQDTALKPVYVRTKEGLGRFAAKMYSPENLEPKFRKAVREMIARQQEKKFPLVKANTPVTLEMDLVTTVMADAVSMIPAVERPTGRTIRYQSDSFTDIMRMILVTAIISGKYRDYV